MPDFQRVARVAAEQNVTAAIDRLEIQFGNDFEPGQLTIRYVAVSESGVPDRGVSIPPTVIEDDVNSNDPLKRKIATIFGWIMLTSQVECLNDDGSVNKELEGVASQFGMMHLPLMVAGMGLVPIIEQMQKQEEERLLSSSAVPEESEEGKEIEEPERPV